MCTPPFSFELKVARDLENLIQKLCKELHQQKDLLNPHALSLMRLYLAALRQYTSWKKNMNEEESKEPAHAILPHSPAQTPPRPNGLTLLPANHFKPPPPESIPAPGLLRRVPDQTPGPAIQRDPRPDHSQSIRDPGKNALAR